MPYYSAVCSSLLSVQAVLPHCEVECRTALRELSYYLADSKLSTYPVGTGQSASSQHTHPPPSLLPANARAAFLQQVGIPRCPPPVVLQSAMGAN